MKRSNYPYMFLFSLMAGFFTVSLLFSVHSGFGNAVGIADSTISADSDSLKLAEGKKLYHSKCNKCHSLYNPGDYKLKVWKENLDIMKYKAELRNEEYEKIYDYLKASCKK